MAYLARRRFSQEIDTSIGSKELAGLKSGKNQSAKELADCMRGLASRVYYSNDYASQEKAACTSVPSDSQQGFATGIRTR